MNDAVPASTIRRVQRVRHELRRRDLEVQHVQRLSPGFVGITLGGEALADFASDGFDDHVKLLFDDATRRDFTPRAFDRAAGTLTIEFALHGHGPAAAWARSAAPGQRLDVGGPRGSMVVPLDYDWHLLAGDATALPAISRRLDELPSGARAIAVVSAEAADRRTFVTRAALDVRWVDGDAALVAALRALQLPSGDGFVWCAGEASAMAQLREVMFVAKQHPREAARIAAYWKRGAADFHDDTPR